MIAPVLITGDAIVDGILSHIEEVLEAKKVFERKRKNNRSKALGILLHHYGPSLRKCKSIVSGFEPISLESIRKWYHKTDTIFTVNTSHRELIAVNETTMKINGKLYILWAAIDVHTYEVLGVWITKGRASIEAYSFLKHILKRCVNHPKIFVDDGPWYVPALQRLHVEWEHVTFGLRNPREQWFFLLKHRIKVFYRNWPYHATADSTQ